jgi:hypothetical protein
LRLIESRWMTAGLVAVLPSKVVLVADSGVPARRGILRTIAAAHHQRNQAVATLQRWHIYSLRFRCSRSSGIKLLSITGVRNDPLLEVIPYRTVLIILRTRSHSMRAGKHRYSQPMWSRIDRCYRAREIMFSGSYTYGNGSKLQKLRLPSPIAFTSCGLPCTETGRPMESSPTKCN